MEAKKYEKKASSQLIKNKSKSSEEEEKKGENNNDSGEWSKDEDKLLLDAVQMHKEGSWNEISNHLEKHTPQECRQRWLQQVDPAINRGEKAWAGIINDVMLILGVRMFKSSNWADISSKIFNKRIRDAQCSERYNNILDPTINNKDWTEEDD